METAKAYTAPEMTDPDNDTGPKTDPTGGYQICVHLGVAPAALVAAGIRCVELHISDASADTVIASLENSPLKAADFRSEALFSIAAGTDRDIAVLAYAALIGFSGKRPDIAVGDLIVSGEELDALGRSIPDAGAPDPVIYQVQVGSVMHPTLKSVSFASSIAAIDASAVRYARRLRFAPATDAAQALTQLIVIAGMRAKGAVDRLPYLVNGDEPFDPASPLEIVGTCLDTLKGRANAVRRGRHGGNRTCVVDPAPDDMRLALLRTAASAPIDDALVWLGGRQNADTGLWHCPRPERHTNGDANASMRTAKGRVRCFRCDGERVDALRLTMDVKQLSPDDAAAWLIATAAERGVQLADPGIGGDNTASDSVDSDN